MCVRVVVDYADTVSASTMVSRTYKTMRTLVEKFEGFSQILKEQSGEKSYIDVFTRPIAIM